MKIEILKVADLIPYENNAKLHPAEQVKQIKTSIEEFGFNDPIAIDENNVVIEGHGRLLAIKELGYEDVECIRIEGLTEEQKRAYILVHNKLTMNTGFDLEILNRELEKIKGIDMKQFDFDFNFDFDTDIDTGDGTQYSTKVEIPHYEPTGEKLLITSAKQFDKICDLMLDFLDATKADSVALAQGGDFIGGKNGDIFKQRVKRKAMNSFFCRTDKRFDFIGRINEDVNTYCYLGSQGKLFLTIADVMLTQVTTQKNNGGMTDVYLDSGTYLKTIYTVILCPSFVKISCMGMTHRRIHHRINWNKGVPLILHERWKK